MIPFFEATETLQPLEKRDNNGGTSYKNKNLSKSF